MTISIVIPGYNGERYLSQTIESVVGQTVTEWELVIVDDGSTDRTSEVAAQFGNRIANLRIVRQDNRGIANARNRGFMETSGTSEYIIFLDQDDVWEPTALELLLSALDSQPGAMAASGLSRRIDEHGVVCEPGELEGWGRHRWGVMGGSLVALPVSAPTTLAVLAYRSVIHTPGQVLIRRSTLNSVGLFDASASPCDDWDMWLRLCLRGYIAYVDKVVLNVRRHENNASRDRGLMFDKIDYVRRKLISSPLLLKDERRIVLSANRIIGNQLCVTRLRQSCESLSRGQLLQGGRQLREALEVYLKCLRCEPVELSTFTSRPRLEDLYRIACTTPSDIQEHLGTLRRLAHRCERVTEFGTRWGMSTTALLCGRPKSLLCYDRVHLPSIDVLEAAARDDGHTQFEFHQADVLQVEIQETDLLFVDTWHVYEQLKRELAMHAGKVRKYLVFHDTTTYGGRGETPGHRGIWPAVEEFLRENPDWSLAARYMHNNGLTILERRPRAVRAGARVRRVLPRRPGTRAGGSSGGVSM